MIALALIYFGTSAGLYTSVSGAPADHQQLGVPSMTVGFLNAIPLTSSPAVAMVLWSRYSDPYRRAHLARRPGLHAAAVGLVVAAGANSVVGLIAALTVNGHQVAPSCPCGACLFDDVPVRGAAAATGIVNSIGNLAASPAR